MLRIERSATFCCLQATPFWINSGSEAWTRTGLFESIRRVTHVEDAWDEPAGAGASQIAPAASGWNLPASTALPSQPQLEAQPQAASADEVARLAASVTQLMQLAQGIKKSQEEAEENWSWRPSTSAATWDWKDSSWTSREDGWWNASGGPTGNKVGRGDFSDPPEWPGWQHYRVWKKAVTRWARQTDVSEARRADKTLKLLSWDMNKKFEHIPDHVLQSDKGVEGLPRA